MIDFLRDFGEAVEESKERQKQQEANRAKIPKVRKPSRYHAKRR